MKNLEIVKESNSPKWDPFSALKELTGTHSTMTSRNFELFDDEGGVFKIFELRGNWVVNSFRALTFFLFLFLVSRQEKERQF